VIVHRIIRVTSVTRWTRTPAAVARKEPIVHTYLQFQTEVCFWCSFVFMQ